MADPLPDPTSEEVQELLPGTLHRVLYAVLFEARESPPTMKEIQAAVRVRLGDDTAAQVHLSKRVRELRDHFEIRHPTPGNGFTYKLLGRRVVPKADPKISLAVRAEVLRHQRCAMCGRTPAVDDIRLHVDHKIPREWGGSSESPNLQPLCSDCNEGKKSYFATFDEYAPEISEAVAHNEPHKRIGELLKAVEPDEVRSDLLELVASAHQYQDDWQKRLRELRVLGWRITHRRQRDQLGRVRVYWRLVHFEAWPSGNVAAEIRRRENVKRAARRVRS